MKIKKYIIYTIIYFLVFTNFVNAKENKILFKINNEIITSIDILEELKYLSIINEEFKNTKKKQAIEIAKNSLIREKIKKIELLNYYENIALEEKILENIIINYFSRLNINSVRDFEFYFNEKKIDTAILKEKITIEVLWNQLIYRKYSKSIRINKDDIVKNLNKNKKQKEFLLSEIVFNVNTDEKYKDKLNLIKKTIKEKSFSQAALIHSISDTSKTGGKLNWIKESVLNNRIKNELNDIQIGDLTNPILIPGGFIILKIEDIKLTKIPLNIDQEVEKITKQQTNDQLNRYSNIYFSKIKKNVLINEL